MNDSPAASGSDWNFFTRLGALVSLTSCTSAESSDQCQRMIVPARTVSLDGE
jgi:hypothetical protein